MISIILYYWNLYYNSAYEYYLQNYNNDNSYLYNRMYDHIKDIIDDIPKETIDKLPNEIDLVLSGGGFKSSYYYGILLGIEYINKKHNKLLIKRISGTSSGTIMGLIMLSKEFEKSLNFAFAVCNTFKKYKFMKPYPLWKHFILDIINNNDISLDNSLYISITEIFPLKNKIYSSYNNKKDLCHAIMCSCSIPYLMTKNILNKYNSKYILDGGFTNNTPIFNDNLRKQLVVKNLNKLYGRKLIYFTKEEIIKLCFKGMYGFKNFLINDNNTFIELI